MPADGAKVDAVTTKIKNGHPPEGGSEAALIRQIADRHGLSGEGLVVFVAEIRRQARHRRQRMSDGQIETLVGRLGDPR